MVMMKVDLSSNTWHATLPVPDLGYVTGFLNPFQLTLKRASVDTFLKRPGVNYNTNISVIYTMLELKHLNWLFHPNRKLKMQPYIFFIRFPRPGIL